MLHQPTMVVRQAKAAVERCEAQSMHCALRLCRRRHVLGVLHRQRRTATWYAAAKPGQHLVWVYSPTPKRFSSVTAPGLAVRLLYFSVPGTLQRGLPLCRLRAAGVEPAAGGVRSGRDAAGGLLAAHPGPAPAETQPALRVRLRSTSAARTRHWCSCPCMGPQVHP